MSQGDAQRFALLIQQIAAAEQRRRGGSQVAARRSTTKIFGGASIRDIQGSQATIARIKASDVGDSPVGDTSIGDSGAFVGSKLEWKSGPILGAANFSATDFKDGVLAYTSEDVESDD